MDNRWITSKIIDYSNLLNTSLETLEKVYDALASEPQTPNEIADKINLNQKTVQGALLQLSRS